MANKRLTLAVCSLLLILAVAAIVLITASDGDGARPSHQNQTNGGNAPGNQPSKPDGMPATDNSTLPSAPNQPPASGCGVLRAYVINVSQADAILIITPANKTILIDAGSGMKKNSASNAVAFLKSRGIGKIDYLIASHYHEDHIGGMDDVFANFEVGSVYDNGNCGNYSSAVQRKFQQLASAHEFIHVKQDMDINADPCLSQARLVVAYDRPQGCWPSGSDTSNENENSVMLRLAYGNTSMFFAGDCEANCEQALISQGTLLRSDFLKVDHHGSATSSTQPFLSAVAPQLFAISTDLNRSVIDGYYHPRQLALGNIYAQGGRAGSVFRTDLEGDIAAVSDGETISVSAPSPATECQLFSGYASANISSYGVIPALAASCKSG
jgi:beta-lactamase superfamily II metal-dependent hydrolase